MAYPRRQRAGRTRRLRPPIRRARSRAPTHACAPSPRTPRGLAAANAPRRTRGRSASVRRGTLAPRGSASPRGLRGTDPVALRWAPRKTRCCGTCGKRRPRGASAAGSPALSPPPTARGPHHCTSCRRAVVKPPSRRRARCHRSSCTDRRGSTAQRGTSPHPRPGRTAGHCRLWQVSVTKRATTATSTRSRDSPVPPHRDRTES